MINQRTSLEIAGEDRSIEFTLSGVQKQLNTKTIRNEDNNDILWKEKCDELSKRGDTRREDRYKKLWHLSFFKNQTSITTLACQIISMGIL